MATDQRLHAAASYWLINQYEPARLTTAEQAQTALLRDQDRDTLGLTRGPCRPDPTPPDAIIISGGENISTVEVEHAIESHPAVLEAAVVGVPDEKWGERPKAFVVLRPGAEASEANLLEHVRAHLARYKAPKGIEFLDALPRTSSGQVQKFELREKEWAGHTSRIQG